MSDLVDALKIVTDGTNGTDDGQDPSMTAEGGDSSANMEENKENTTPGGCEGATPSGDPVPSTSDVMEVEVAVSAVNNTSSSSVEMTSSNAENAAIDDKV